MSAKTFLSLRKWQPQRLRQWQSGKPFATLLCGYGEAKHVCGDDWGVAFSILTNMALSLAQLLRQEERTLREVRERCGDDPLHAARILGLRRETCERTDHRTLPIYCSCLMYLKSVPFGMLFFFWSKMQNIVRIIVASLIFVSGCQTFHNPRWLTPRKESGHHVLGQAPFIEPVFNATTLAPPVPLSVINPFAPVQQGALGSDLAAEEAEKERIKALATAPRNGVPDYLKPLNPLYGHFAHRTRKHTLEHDIIGQVGYEQVAERINSEMSVFDWEKEETKKRFDWSILDPTKSFSKARDWAGLGPDEEKANESMKKGWDILQANPDLKDRKKNLEAAKHFIEAAKKYPDSLLEEDALYFIGECYFFADDYLNAFSMYQKLVVKYPHSKHIDTAVRRLFKIGRYWELASEQWRLNFNVTDKSLPRYDTFGFAKKAYETIFTYDPTGPVSDLALMTLATAYLKKGRYQGDYNYHQAAYYYRQIREHHPLSPYIAKAYEYELYALTQSYMGAEYPGRTLEEAKKLAEITLRQFGNGLDREDRASILAIREDILAKEAEQLWKKGQFHDLKKREYGSARIHYKTLITEYPQTQYAEKARERMELIKDLPDDPSIFDFPINPFKAER